jgi:hypothetical protein
LTCGLTSKMISVKRWRRVTAMLPSRQRETEDRTAQPRWRMLVPKSRMQASERGVRRWVKLSARLNERGRGCSRGKGGSDAVMIGGRVRENPRLSLCQRMSGFLKAARSRLQAPRAVFLP